MKIKSQKLQLHTFRNRFFALILNQTFFTMQKSLSAPITFFFAFPPLSASSAQVPPAPAGSSLTGSGNWIGHFTGLPFRKIVYTTPIVLPTSRSLRKLFRCAHTPPSSAAAYIPAGYEQLPGLKTCDMSGRELFTWNLSLRYRQHSCLCSSANKAP